MVGKPVIRGTRVPVYILADMHTLGSSVEEIVDDYEVPAEAVEAAIAFDRAAIIKVVAYITHGDRLLVFNQPDAPEAGLQVPSGTVKHGESLEVAVLREAMEETGLTDLEIIENHDDWLIDMRPYGKNEIHKRWFFHLTTRSTPPESWEHVEPDPSDASSAPIIFRFHWAEYLDGSLKLAARQHSRLHCLLPDPPGMIRIPFSRGLNSANAETKSSS
jgi:uncharacterized protein (DUF433 family)